MTDPAKLNALHWARLKVFLERSGQRKYWRQRVAELEAEIAKDDHLNTQVSV